MKPSIILILLISLTITIIASQGRRIPLERVIYESDLVIIGKVLEIKKSAVYKDQDKHLFDTVLILIDSVLLDQTERGGYEIGEVIAKRMSSPENNKRASSDSFEYYSINTSGFWILSRSENGVFKSCSRKTYSDTSKVFSIITAIQNNEINDSTIHLYEEDDEIAELLKQLKALEENQ